MAPMKGVVAKIVVPLGASAPTRANTAMVTIRVNNTVAERTEEFGVEDFGAQALLYHCFVEKGIDFVASGGVR